MGKESLFRAVKGMNDLLPAEAARWQRLERSFAETARLHGYGEVRTPLVERTELFVRSIGETTDVVSKEMYTFDRHDESLTLRPEGTASAARAYLEHAVHGREPVTRWYYVGPMFRAERAQRGRYRQFHQAGCEIYGDRGPGCDAEIIDMLRTFFGELGISALDVRVSSLGGREARTAYRDRLVAFLEPRASELSELSRQRLVSNPLRILDSKDPGDQALLSGAPSIHDVLTEDDRAHFDGLRRYLDALGTPYVVDGGMVRGLDYYTRTVFEIRSDAGELGAQNTLVGGGRYDGMIESLGGPPTPAIGFALGLERLLLAMPSAGPEAHGTCFFAPLGDRATEVALGLARDLRKHGVRAEVDSRGGSLKSLLRRANGLAARLCVVIGDAEVERGVAQVKDLNEHTQDEVALDRAVVILADRLLGSAITAPGGVA